MKGTPPIWWGPLRWSGFANLSGSSQSVESGIEEQELGDHKHESETSAGEGYQAETRQMLEHH